MFLDKYTQLSNAQAFAATAVSTNAYDLGATTPARDVGAGEDLSMMIAVSVAASAGGTFVFEVIESASDTLGTPTVLVSRTILAAALTAGSVHEIPIPANAISLRYLGARATLGGTTPTITASIYIIPGSFVQAFRAYASGFVMA